MSTLKELSEFPEHIFRVDVGTPVKGYDPETEEDGPSNLQAQQLANRTQWLKDKIQSLLEEYVSTVNGESGEVTITLAALGGEKEGTAKEVLKGHLEYPDPHRGYLNQTRGDARYLQLTEGNKASSWLQLDERGKIPADIIEGLKARYAVVDNEEERLALETHNDLTICAQLNGSEDGSDQLYYLNAGSDPSVKENWVLGRSAVLAGVSSMFGRTGQVVSQTGDYNTDQITETETRVFLTPEEKDDFHDKQDKLVSGENVRTLHGKSLLGPGDVKLTSEEVGADPKGTASKELTTHIEKEDPHPTYLNESRADERYVKDSTANKPLGYVKLDESGKLPASVIDIVKARYVIVGDNAERLSLPIYSNLTICAQLNGEGNEDDEMWYLNANLDPSIEDNWILGQSAVVLGVKSVFGRTGIVNPQAGDYNADQITETEERTFLTPKERASFTSKQEKLSSGKNLATVFGKSLLSSEGITLKDADGFNVLVGESLVPGSNVSIKYDEETDKIIIDVPEQKDPRNNLKVIEVEKATAKEYEFIQSRNVGFNFRAYALKETLDAAASQINLDYSTLLPNLAKTTLPDFDKTGFALLISPNSYSLASSGDMIESASIDVSRFVEKLTIESDTTVTGIVPIFTAANSNTEFTPISSKPYSGYEPWKAFQAPFTTVDKVAAGTYWSDIEYFGSSKTETWLGVAHETAVEVSAYQFQVTGTFALGTSTHITGWYFQGRNEDSDDWITLDTQTNQDITKGLYFNQYYLDKVYSYKQYRVLVSSVVNPGARTSIPRFQILNTKPFVIKTKNGKYYVPSSDGTVTEVEISSLDDVNEKGYRGRVDFLSAELIGGSGEYKLLSSEETSIIVTGYGYSPQIVLHGTVNAAVNWLSLMSIIPTTFYDDSDKEKIKYAITFDGTEWFRFINEKWDSIGALTNNIESARIVNEKGMGYDTISKITQEQWESLLIKSTSSPNLGIALSADIRNNKEHTVPKIITLSNDKVSSWQMVSSSDVWIGVRKNSIVFKPSSAGNYKFCYEFIG